VIRVGSAVGGGVLAAVVASLPATMRLGDGGSMFRAGTGWMALAALAMPIAVLFVGVLRRARTGAQLVAGDRLEVVASGVLAWTTLQILFTGSSRRSCESTPIIMASPARRSPSLRSCAASSSRSSCVA
jgi:hypothetical protein